MIRDHELIEKRLAVIESCLGDLRRLARPELLGTDVREERFVEHTLQLAIQAALDVASHIASERRLGEVRSNRELFTSLARDGWMPADLRVRLGAMAGFTRPERGRHCRTDAARAARPASPCASSRYKAG